MPIVAEMGREGGVSRRSIASDNLGTDDDEGGVLEEVADIAKWTDAVVAGKLSGRIEGTYDVLNDCSCC